MDVEPAATLHDLRASPDACGAPLFVYSVQANRMRIVLFANSACREQRQQRQLQIPHVVRISIHVLACKGIIVYVLFNHTRLLCELTTWPVDT